MSIDKSFEEIVDLQFRTNSLIIGDNWTGILEYNNTPIDFSCCTLVEAGELLTSTKYKWWKKSAMDKDNIVVELIDILHFEISNLLIEYSEVEDANSIILDIMNQGWKTNLELNEKINREFFGANETMTQAIYNDIVKRIVFLSIMPDEMVEDKDGKFINLFANIFLFLTKMGLTKEDVIKAYLIKNVLNRIRNIHGYADGTYQKDWINTKNNTIYEDNVMAKILCADLENITYDSIFEILNDYYISIVKIY